jgi:asparagine synthase (glutamine-hydrolysing)
MSGVFGVCNAKSENDFRTMEGRLRDFESHEHTRLQMEFASRGACLLGRRHLGVFSQPDLPAARGDSPLLVTTGYCLSDDTAALGWSPKQRDAVLDLLDAGRYEGLAALNGSFQCACLDRQGRVLRLFNDRFGLTPLFLYCRPPCLAFASEPDLLLLLMAAGGHETFALDRAALNEWLEIGFLMGKRMLLKDVTILPAASVLTWDGQRLDIKRYWQPQYAEGEHRFDRVEMIAAIDTAIRRSVKRRVSGTHRAAISLSGGLDSRLLLAAAVGENLPVSAVTYGPENSPDHAIAAETVSLFDVEHSAYYDNPAAAVQSFEAVIRRTAGMTNILNSWGMQHGPAIGAQADLLINGIGGNELLGFLAFDLLRFLVPRSTSYLSRWLAAKLNPGWSTDDLELTRKELMSDSSTITNSISDYWHYCPASTSISRVYNFFLSERNQRANALGVALDDPYVEPIAPFLDNEVVDLALKVPPNERLLARFYRQLLRTHYPEAAGLRYSRTGLPASASTPRLFGVKLKQALTRHSHDPAHPWDHWLRNDLRDYVREMLLTPGTRSAGVLPPEIVRRKTNAFLNGEPVPAMVIGQLLSLEIFLRTFRPETC